MYNRDNHGSHHGPLDKSGLARLTDAFALLSSIYASGGHGRIDRGAVAWTNVSGNLSRQTGRLEEEMKLLLSGPSVKDWAKGRRDIALAFVREGPEIRVLAALELFERRHLGTMAVFNIGKDGESAFAAFMKGANGILLAGPDKFDRAAIGRLCARAGVGRGRLEIIEAASRKKPQDYRNYLAGSFWLDMPSPEESDVVSHALLTALQVRSTRKFGMTFYKQGFYTALGVAQAAGEGLGKEEIAAEFDLSPALVEEWSRKAFRSPEAKLEQQSEAFGQSEEPSSNSTSNSSSSDVSRPATAKQQSFVDAILRDLPWLVAVLPANWRNDAAAVSAFLSGLQSGDTLAARRARGKDILRAAELRREIACGKSLDEACASTKISRSDGLLLLDRDYAEDVRLLEEDLREAMGAPVNISPI